VAGGANTVFLNSVETYNPATNAWSTLANMPTARAFLCGAAVNGLFYAIGGANTNSGQRLNANEAYNPAMNSWATMAFMPTPRSNVACGTINGMIYVVSGVDSSSAFVQIVEAYNTSTNTWTSVASIPIARGDFSVAVQDGILYAIGGSTASGYTASVEAYNPATNSWTEKSPLPLPVGSALASVAVNGRIFAMGGSDQNNQSNQFNPATFEYDPVTNTWTTVTPIITPRDGLAAVAKNGVIYAIDGYNGSTFAGANEAFYPPNMGPPGTIGAQGPAGPMGLTGAAGAQGPA
jgi:N-acetylneuraminic acid mutarotase